MRVALLDRRAQCRSGPEQVLLTDELLDRARTHAYRQWARVGAVCGAFSRLPAWIFVKQGMHSPEYRVCGGRIPGVAGRLTSRVVEL